MRRWGRRKRGSCLWIGIDGARSTLVSISCRILAAISADHVKSENTPTQTEADKQPDAQITRKKAEQSAQKNDTGRLKDSRVDGIQTDRHEVFNHRQRETQTQRLIQGMKRKMFTRMDGQT